MIRPVLMYMYGAEAWTVTRREEQLLERTAMRMLAVVDTLSVTEFKDKKRNEVIRKSLWVACITDKIREARLRWGDVIQQDIIDMKSLRLKKEQTAGRKKWRGRIRVVDPSPLLAGLRSGYCK